MVILSITIYPSQEQSFILGYAKTQLKHPKQHHEKLCG
jgi:hypothetical protein